MKKKIFYGALILFLIPVIILAIYFRFDIPLEDLKQKYTDAESEFIEIDGMKVHYKDEGQGFPLVLLHGTSASLFTWNTWTEILKKDFRIIRLDLPAFALTGPHPENDYSIKAYTVFLNHFLEKLQIKECYLAGNSLGGGIAWNFAVDYPEKVKKLILIDASGYPSTKGAPWVFELAKIPVLNQVVRYVTPQYFFKKNLLDVYGDDSKVTDSLVNVYYELNMREGNRAAFIERAKVRNQYEPEKLKGIKIPTLILWGKEDNWVELANGEQMNKDIPSSKLIVYEGVGHLPMEEFPEKSAEDAKAFLKGK